VDRILRNSIPAKQFVDSFPGFRLDGQEALVQEGEVHDGPLPHPQEVLEERVAADANDRLTEGQPFKVLHDQGPQDILRSVVALASLGVAFGELLEILMDRRKNLGIVVEDLTDCAVSVTIVAYDLGQPVVIGLETQHGFLLSTHPCSPSWSTNKHEDKDASLFFKLDRLESTQNPFRNRNYIDLISTPSAQSKEISEGVVLDYDAEGNLVGIDIDNASRKIDLKEVILSKIPAEIEALTA
jgi:uncharacterized protein YuzE